MKVGRRPERKESGGGEGDQGGGKVEVGKENREKGVETGKETREKGGWRWGRRPDIKESEGG